MAEEPQAQQAQGDSQSRHGSSDPPGPSPVEQDLFDILAPSVAKSPGHLSATHLLLVGNTLVLAALAMFVLRWARPKVQPISAYVPGPVHAVPSSQPQTLPAETVGFEPVSLEGPVSWQRARSAFASGDYAAALTELRLLAKPAQTDPAGDLLRDFLQLRIGQCLRHLGEPAQARDVFDGVASSRSPAVRAAANYERAMLDEREDQFLQARMHAYLAVAALAAMSRPTELEAACDFLVARALTKKALSFYPVEAGLPWTAVSEADPFAPLDEKALQEFLADGAEPAGQALLGPRIEPLPPQGDLRFWRVACVQSAVEDLLHPFATGLKMDVQLASADPRVRRRPISAVFRQVSAHRLCEVAAGSVGLLARFTGDRLILHDPQASATAAQQRDLLLAETVSAWRRAFLRVPQAKPVPEGHFAVALMHELSGETIAAVNEYQLVAQRHAGSLAAPPALLRSARLRMQLGDHSGAKTDLMALLDCYPDCRQTPEAYLTLGEANLTAGRPEQALRDFRKLYYLDLSPASKALACLGAGRCLYVQGRHVEATQWLGAYLSIAHLARENRRGEALLLLGKSYAAVGELSAAIAAFQQVLLVRPAGKDQADAALCLARAYWRRGKHAQALAALQGGGLDDCPEEQRFESLRLAGEIYRSMSLPDRGAGLLRKAIPSLSDDGMRGSLGVQLARCYWDAGQLVEAYQTFTESLPLLSPGPEARLAACDLADLCLETDRPQQAAAVAGEVMRSARDDDAGRRAAKTLAEAYSAQRMYERAAAVLSGQVAGPAGNKERHE